VLVKTKGIVLKSVKYSETSLILDIYTEEKGLRSCIVSGVRKAKSKTASLYQVLQILDVIIYDKDAQKLNRIKEASSAYLYRSITLDIHKTNLAIFLIDIASHTIKEHEANPELFSFIEMYLRYLDNTNESIALLSIKFMLDLSSFLGFAPLDNFGVHEIFFDLEEGKYVSEDSRGNYILPLELSQHLRTIHNMEMQDVQNYTVPKADRTVLLDKLVLYYKLHLEGFKDPKSLEVFRGL